VSTLPPSQSFVETDPEVQLRSSSLGARLMLAANLTFQFSFLFAYLYLRANNFDGGWHPDGVSTPPLGVFVAVVAVTALAFPAAWVASQSAARDGVGAVRNGPLVIALVAGLASIGLWVWQLTHTGWTPDQGTYVDTSILWFAALAAQVTIGCFWLLRIVAGNARGTVPARPSEVRSVAEYLGFVAAWTVGVFLLVQIVT